MSEYIALEGIEGAGKSTVADALSAALEATGHTVCQVREPGGTVTGEGIRRVLLDPAGDLAPWTESLLFAAARAQLVNDVVRPALDRGETVVSDRSVYSSLAYQGGGRGLGIERVRALNSPGLGGTWPTLVVLVRIAPATGLDRQEVPDRIGAEGIAFQSEVAATFEALAEAEADRFLVADGTRPVADIVATIADEVARRIEARL